MKQHQLNGLVYVLYLKTGPQTGEAAIEDPLSAHLKHLFVHSPNVPCVGPATPRVLHTTFVDVPAQAFKAVHKCLESQTTLIHLQPISLGAFARAAGAILCRPVVKLPRRESRASALVDCKHFIKIRLVAGEDDHGLQIIRLRHQINKAVECLLAVWPIAKGVRLVYKQHPAACRLHRLPHILLRLADVGSL